MYQLSIEENDKSLFDRKYPEALVNTNTTTISSNLDTSQLQNDFPFNMNDEEVEVTINTVGFFSSKTVLSGKLALSTVTGNAMGRYVVPLKKDKGGQSPEMLFYMSIFRGKICTPEEAVRMYSLSQHKGPIYLGTLYANWMDWGVLFKQHSFVNPTMV